MATTTRSRRKAPLTAPADSAPVPAVAPVAAPAAPTARKRPARQAAAAEPAAPAGRTVAAKKTAAAKKSAVANKSPAAKRAGVARKAVPAGKAAPVIPAKPPRKAAAKAAPASQAAAAEPAAPPVAVEVPAPVETPPSPKRARGARAAPAKPEAPQAPAAAESTEPPARPARAGRRQPAAAATAPAELAAEVPLALLVDEEEPVEPAAAAEPATPSAPAEIVQAAMASDVIDAPVAPEAMAPSPTPGLPETPVAAARGRSRGRGRGRGRQRQAHGPESAAQTEADATPEPAPAEAEAPAPQEAAPVEPAAPAEAPQARPSRGNRRRQRHRGEQGDGAPAAALPATDAADTSTAPQEVAAPPTAEPDAAPAPAPTGPAHSAIVLIDGDRRRIAWQPGHACPPALLQAAAQRLDDSGHLPPGDDGALPALLRLANDGGHSLRVDQAVWSHLAAHRDARTRLALLEVAYPDGPASAALQSLLRVPLPMYQAEGALFAVIAGRALLADERGLGKGVQAIAAAGLWRRHFGVRRVLVLCPAAQRAAWQRAWQRFTGEDAPPPTAQVMEGGLMQRQALWGTDAGVRILSPEALASDAAHIVHWAPDLVIIDEPQQLDLHDEAWAALRSPHALVLSGAPLADQPALTDTLVAWLDTERLGPLAALHELQQAAEQGRVLGEDDIERLTNDLSRLMLQRGREDVADQLPALVHSELPVALAPGQREAHDAALAQARRLLAGWRASAYLSDADQWRLSEALRAMQWAAHRADPADPASALAEASVQAIETQLAAWASTGPLNVALLCPSGADREQLAARLAAPDGLVLVAPGEALPDGPEVVLQFGVPWRPRRQPAGARGASPAGQQQLYLVALDSIDAGLFDTLALRTDAPRGPADGRGFLQGERLGEWLGALQAALQALPAATAG